HLATLYSGSAMYYREMHTTISGSTLVPTERCAVASSQRVPGTPGSRKQFADFSTEVSFLALGFSISNAVYFGYSIEGAGACGIPNGTAAVYTFRAEGDLDDDGDLSLFELTAGSNAHGDLYRSQGFHSANEHE